MPARATTYPRVRTANFLVFTREGLLVFNFSDLQAATGFELREGRLAVNMLTTFGLMTRVNERPLSKPLYALTDPGLQLVRRDQAVLPATQPNFVDVMKTISARYPFGIVEISASATAIDGRIDPRAEVAVLVRNKREIAGELVAARAEIQEALGMPVDIMLLWEP